MYSKKESKRKKKFNWHHKLAQGPSARSIGLRNIGGGKGEFRQKFKVAPCYTTRHSPWRASQNAKWAASSNRHPDADSIWFPGLGCSPSPAATSATDGDPRGGHAMNPQPHLVSSQDAPAKADFLWDVRQFDDPTLFLIPWAGSCPPYQAWRTWTVDALVGGRLLYEALWETAATAYRASVNSDQPSPCWPSAVLTDINKKLLSLQVREFLLNSGAGPYLFIDFEKKAKIAVRRRWS